MPTPKPKNIYSKSSTHQQNSSSCQTRKYKHLWLPYLYASATFVFVCINVYHVMSVSSMFN